MLPQTIQLATTNQGKRYIVKSIHNRIVGRKQEPYIVLTFGDVLSVSGFSVKHGPDKKFQFGKVTITEVERTEELLQSLFDQDQGMRTA
jgi:hypothetical protein